MTSKLLGLSTAAFGFNIAKWYCILTAVLEFYDHTVTHPWLYYALWLGLMVAFSGLQQIFMKGAIDERASLAKPQD